MLNLTGFPASNHFTIVWSLPSNGQAQYGVERPTFPRSQLTQQKFSILSSLKSRHQIRLQPHMPMIRLAILGQWVPR